MWWGATVTSPPSTTTRAIGGARARVRLPSRRPTGTARATTAMATVNVPTNLRWLGLGRCSAMGSSATDRATRTPIRVLPDPRHRQATTTSTRVPTISSQNNAAIWAGRSSPGRLSGPRTRSSSRAKKSPLSDGSGGRGSRRPARRRNTGSTTMPSNMARGPTSTRWSKNGERPATAPVPSRALRSGSAARKAGTKTTKAAGIRTTWWKVARPHKAAPTEARRPSSPSRTRAVPAISRPKPAIHG